MIIRAVAARAAAAAAEDALALEMAVGEAAAAMDGAEWAGWVVEAAWEGVAAVSRCTQGGGRSGTGRSGAPCSPKCNQCPCHVGKTRRPLDLRYAVCMAYAARVCAIRRVRTPELRVRGGGQRCQRGTAPPGQAGFSVGGRPAVQDVSF